MHIIVLSCKLGQDESIASDLDDLFSLIELVSRNDASDGLNEVMDSVCISL